MLGNTLDEKESKEPEGLELIQQGEKNDLFISDDKRDVSEIEDFAERNGKLYRYERNVNGVPNRGMEVVKSILYWLKGLILSTNKE